MVVRNAYMSDGSYTAEREQRIGHERYQELVNEHYIQPVNGMFDNMMTSVLKL